MNRIKYTTPPPLKAALDDYMKASCETSRAGASSALIQYALTRLGYYPPNREKIERTYGNPARPLARVRERGK